MLLQSKHHLVAFFDAERIANVFGDRDLSL
jgi:hypothetical protein